MNDRLKQWFNQWDWLILIITASIFSFYTLWSILIMLVLWTVWKVYLNWEEYDLATDLIANQIRIMRKAKFVWKKKE
jgi:hypothetical protein